MRLYLLGTYAAQASSEVMKWLLGHKRSFRAERVRMYAQVLRTGLRPQQRKVVPPPVLLITGEFPPAQGGVGDYTCRLSQALARQGVDTRVLTRASDEAEANYDLRITNYELQSSGVYRPSSIVHRPRRIALRSVLRTLRGTRASVAHIQYQTGAFEMRPTVNLLPLLLRLYGGSPPSSHSTTCSCPTSFPRQGRCGNGPTACSLAPPPPWWPPTLPTPLASPPGACVASN